MKNRLFGNVNARFLNSLAIFWIVVLGVIVYSNTFFVPFHFDDLLTIVENPNIKDIGNLSRMWYFDPSRFLTYVSFALNYHFGGLQVVSYHIVNLTLHIFTAITCYYFIRMTLYKLSVLGYIKESYISATSLLAALIFTVHPIQTQAVTYISQRSTLLATFSYLLCFVGYVQYRDTERRGFYVFALISLAFGLFTKPIIVTVPFALFLYEICFYRNEKISRTGVLILPFFLLSMAVPFLLMQYFLSSIEIFRILDITKETSSISRTEYLFTQFNVMMTYLRLIFVPIGQNLDYAFPISKSLFEFPTWLSFCVVTGILATAAKAYHRHRLFCFAIFWAAVTLSLESSIFPIADVINEHRLYLPMVGLSLLLAYWLVRFLPNKRVLFLVSALIVLVLSVMTYQRNKVWNDRIRFLKDVAGKSEEKARVHNNLAIAYAESGDLESAEAEYKKAIEINPNYFQAYSNLANIYFEHRDYEKAEKLLLQAVEFNPEFAGAYYNLGNVYYSQNDIERARTYYLEAIRVNQSFTFAYVALGRLYARFGDWERGMFCLKYALKIDPGHASAYIGLGDLYLNKGQYEEAIKQYKEAIKREPAQVVVYNNLGNIYDILGDYRKAAQYYHKSISIDSQYPHAYFNLGNTLSKIGNLKESKDMLRKAMALYKELGDEVMLKRVKEKLKDFP